MVKPRKKKDLRGSVIHGSGPTMRKRTRISDDNIFSSSSNPFLNSRFHNMTLPFENFCGDGYDLQ